MLTATQIENFKRTRHLASEHAQQGYPSYVAVRLSADGVSLIDGYGTMEFMRERAPADLGLDKALYYEIYDDEGVLVSVEYNDCATLARLGGDELPLLYRTAASQAAMAQQRQALPNFDGYVWKDGDYSATPKRLFGTMQQVEPLDQLRKRFKQAAERVDAKRQQVNAAPLWWEIARNQQAEQQAALIALRNDVRKLCNYD